MSEEKVSYETNRELEEYETFTEVDQFIKHYGIDYERQGWSVDFKNRDIRSAVDDIIRVVKSYKEDPDSQERHKVEKLRSVINALLEADKKAVPRSQTINSDNGASIKTNTKYSIIETKQ